MWFNQMISQKSYHFLYSNSYFKVIIVFDRLICFLNCKSKFKTGVARLFLVLEYFLNLILFVKEWNLSQFINYTFSSKYLDFLVLPIFNRMRGQTNRQINVTLIKYLGYTRFAVVNYKKVKRCESYLIFKSNFGYNCFL